MCPLWRGLRPQRDRWSPPVHFPQTLIPPETFPRGGGQVLLPRARVPVASAHLRDPGHGGRKDRGQAWPGRGHRNQGAPGLGKGRACNHRQYPSTETCEVTVFIGRQELDASMIMQGNSGLQFRKASRSLSHQINISW